MAEQNELQARLQEPLIGYTPSTYRQQPNYPPNANVAYQEGYGQHYRQGYQQVPTGQPPPYAPLQNCNHYGYGAPPPPIPDSNPNPPTDPPVQYNEPHQTEDQVVPPPDPFMNADVILVPKAKVHTHYSLAVGLCVLWTLLFIWPAWPCVLVALGFSLYSKSLAKKDEKYEKARSNGRRACFCAIVSLVVAIIYGITVIMLTPIGVVVYVVVTLNYTTSTSTNYQPSNQQY